MINDTTMIDEEFGETEKSNPKKAEDSKIPAKARKLLGIEKEEEFVGTPVGKFSGAPSADKRSGVAEVMIPMTVPIDQQAAQGIDPAGFKLATQMADVLLANEQLLEELLGD